MVSIHTNVNQLNAAIRRYKAASGKSLDQVLAKQGAKLGFELYKNFRAIMPKSGNIRESNMNRLKSGGGLKVRQSVMEKMQVATDVATRKTVFKVGKKHGRTKTVKGKKLNWWQEAVRRELGAREKARGFTALGAKYPRKEISYGRVAKNKYGALLSEVFTVFGKSPRYIRFSWAGGSKMAELAKNSINSKLAMRGVVAALKTVTKDIMEYVIRKEKEAAAKSGLRLS